MKQLKPPVVPTWLLDRLGVTKLNEALVGDLIEEFRSGYRSRAWYWAQALLAIVIASATEVRAHKLLTFRALLAGEIAATILNIAMARTVNRWGPSFSIVSATWWLYTIGTVFVIYAVSGWLVGRLHRPHGAVMALLFAVITCCLSVWWHFSLLSIHVTNSIDTPRFRPYLAFDISYLAVIWLAVVIGGLVGAADRWAQASSSQP